MGTDLKGKELGMGLSQESTGLYMARLVDRFGKRQRERFKKLHEAIRWIANATYIDEHSDLSTPTYMIVDAWLDYWIDVKKKTVRLNTWRNNSEKPVNIRKIRRYI